MVGLLEVCDLVRGSLSTFGLSLIGSNPHSFQFGLDSFQPGKEDLGFRVCLLYDGVNFWF